MTREVALGEVAEVFNGKTPAKADQRTAGHPVLKIRDVDAFGSIRGNFESFVDVEFAVKFRKKQLHQGDILILNAAHNAEYVASKTFFASQDHQGPLVTGEWTIVRPIQVVADPRYVRHYIESAAAKKRIKEMVNGIHLYPKDVSKCLIPLPPIGEQGRIAAILDKADALRAKRREVIAKVDALLRSVFVEMFGDPRENPLGFPLRSLPEFYSDSDEGTRCGPFGSTLKKTDMALCGVPLWNMDNISMDGEMQLPFRAWVSEEKARQLSGYRVLDGDILISRAGTVGKMCVARAGVEISLMTTNLIRLRLGCELVPEFFVALMTYCKGRVGRLKTGPDGAFTHMSTGVLDTLSFPYPPVALQQEWMARSSAIRAHKVMLSEHLGLMNNQFDSMTERVFSKGGLA